MWTHRVVAFGEVGKLEDQSGISTGLFLEK